MEVIQPSWPAPSWVRAVSTTIQGGLSQAPYASFNLALHVADNPHHVQINRLRVSQQFNWQHEPFWLSQTHSDRVIRGVKPSTSPMGFDADGVWTNQPGHPCAILTGDCLPLLLSDTKGSLVAAVHCGWRGLLNGIIENTLTAIKNDCQGEIIAWFGPAIGPCHFEVGEDVRAPFIQHHPLAYLAFKPIAHQKYLADIYQLARIRLNQCGVNAIYGGQHCTYKEHERFYSHRRNKVTGRIATVIWMQA